MYFLVIRLYLALVVADLRQHTDCCLSFDDVSESYCVVVDLILIGPAVDRFFLIFRLLHMRFMI